MQLILVIIFLLVAFISAFRSRTGAKIVVDTAQFNSGGCGCFSLVVLMVLGPLLYFNIIPQFPFGATLMLILAAVGIIIGTLAGLFTGQTTGKGSYDFGVSLITATFFWVAISYLYFAVFHLTFQISLSSILISTAFIVGESIATYWTASFLKT